MGRASDGKLLNIRKAILMKNKHEKYERLLERCKSLSPTPTAVAHPCDKTSIQGAIEAAELGLLTPILVGPREKVRWVAINGKDWVSNTPWELSNHLTLS